MVRVRGADITSPIKSCFAALRTRNLTSARTCQTTSQGRARQRRGTRGADGSTGRAESWKQLWRTADRPPWSPHAFAHPHVARHTRPASSQLQGVVSMGRRSKVLNQVHAI